MKNRMPFMGLFILLIVAAMPAAHAEEGNATTNATIEPGDDPGITPDSPFYGIENAFDNINLALTFNKEKRAEKALVVARERLAEVKKMLEEGKADKAEKARLKYEDMVQKSESAILALDSDGDAAKAKEALERLAKLQNKSESHYEHVLAVKEKILEDLKGKMTQEQYDHLIAVFAKIENKSLEMDQKIESKRENAKTKYKILSGKNESEVELEEDGIENRSGLALGRIEREKKEYERAKMLLARARDRLRERNITDDNSTDLNEDLDASEELLSEIRNMTNASHKFKYALMNKLREHGNEISAIATLLGDAKMNGTWNETKIRLKEAIRERQEEHRGFIDDKLRGKAEFRNNTYSERIEARMDKRENKTERQDDKLEQRMENRGGNKTQERGREKNKTRMPSGDDSTGESD